MLTPEGRAVLMDFGLAKVAGASRLTRTGATLGTAAYMAPEVLRGETSDTRSDIWSLGIVIYEMLAGHRPFRGEQTATLAYAIMNTEPEPLRAPELPHGSNGVVTRALMKDPARRYPGALELVADLLMIERDHQAAPAGRGRQTRPRHAWAAAALALGIVLLVIALGALDVGGVRHRLLGSRPGIHSIAVLPLTNLSGDANQEYFVDGMTEELINDLGRLNALRVISRTSSMTYKNATKPLKQIARELGVDAIIEGSLLRSGDHVRVMAQLIRTPEERQVWAESYERTTGEAVAIPGDMARAVADELNLGLTPEEQIRIATPRKVNAEAHDAYLRAGSSSTSRTRSCGGPLSSTSRLRPGSTRCTPLHGMASPKRTRLCRTSTCRLPSPSPRRSPPPKRRCGWIRPWPRPTRRSGSCSWSGIGIGKARNASAGAHWS